MGRQKGIINVKGKVGDTTFTGGKYGNVARSTPNLTGRQKKEKAQQPQNLRTACLNALASNVLNAVRYYGGAALVDGMFYSRLHSAFRNEAANHRVLLLEQIQQIEINLSYQFLHRCPLPSVEVSVSKGFYSMEIGIDHPAKSKKEANTFYLQFIFTVWNKDDSCRHEYEHTDWMSMNDHAAKELVLKFKRRPTDTEYLLVCRCVTGINQKHDGYFTSTAMRCLTSGTVTKEGLQLLAEKKLAEEAARKTVPVKAEVREKKRVAVKVKK